MKENCCLQCSAQAVARRVDMFVAQERATYRNIAGAESARFGLGQPGAEAGTTLD